jgi:hypothetical protein
VQITPKQIDRHLKRTAGTSIGCVEQLAGINTFDEAERKALWFRFQHLFTSPGLQAPMRAVMAECKRMAAHRVNAGELSLWPRKQGGAA